jgi:hypothetical protein
VVGLHVRYRTEGGVACGICDAFHLTGVG